jgi:hypothetical protein
MVRTAVLAIVLPGALAAGAWAQTASPAPAAPAAKPKPEGVDYFAGRWHVAARDPGTGEILEVAYTVEPTPGGSWLAGSAASTDGSIQSRDMWGRDPLTGEIIRVIFDGSGTFGTVRSSGWRGDTLVLEGEARSPGGVVRLRETITRKTRERFDAVWEAWRKGEWSPYSIETVTRVI